MPIRLSGMASGLDTDAIVKDLVSAYSTRKDNLVKEQTKLQWKQDAWKDMNTKIYNFYSKNLSSMKLSSAFLKKAATISNTSVAKVSANSTAPIGSQTLEIERLAKAGYLTGAEITKEDGTALKGSDKLTDVKGMADFAGGNITVKVGDIEKTVEIKEDMTISQFVTALKDAGVSASFDEKNGRMFVNSKASGKDANFTFVANDQSGFDALKNLGLMTTTEADKAEYDYWKSLATDGEALAKLKEERYNAAAYTTESLKAAIAKEYDEAKAKADEYKTSAENLQKKLDELNAQLENDTLTDDDKAKIQEEITTVTTDMDDAVAKEAEQRDIMLAKDALLGSDDAAIAAFEAELANRNAAIKTDIEAGIDSKVAFAQTVNLEASQGAVKIDGDDSIIYLNGARYTSETNSYSINGITIEATAETEEPVIITTNTDTEAIYNMVKDFFKSYNELVNGIDKSYNAAAAKDMMPLTDDEKEAMSESEIEKWEEKIKNSLLRRDDTLNSVSTMLKSAMQASFTINGKSYSLASFGIKTAGYFEAADNEKSAYHIDGDPDDSLTSGNTDKLKEAIANDPDAVVSFFTQLADKAYTKLGDKMKTSSISSAFKVYNDKSMQSDYEDYTEKIKDWEERIEKIEESYYKQFSAMEKALSQLQSSTSALTSMLGQ
ncbi:MAG: flagellar filament capping protein FliD [Lachnospiraceae bacterium]|nr:flagellar filament capping protein FliD [Lachnospiraceae bacterium]